MTTFRKIQRAIVLVMAIAMLSVAVPAFAQATTGKVCTVNARVLNIRSGPGTTYKVTGSFKAGSTFKIVTISGRWAQHDNGWSHMDYTSCGSSQTTPSTPSVAGQQCTDVSPLWENVVVPDQGPEHKVSDDANWQRLYNLTKHYRASGVWTMLKAAGYRWDGQSCLQQFQPEETTFKGTDGEVHTVIVATRLWGTGTASYPTAMSTGETIVVHKNGRIVKFDEHPDQADDVVGRTCTDCSITAGPHSIWSSGGGNTWQLWPDTTICTVNAEVTLAPGQVPSGQSPDCH